MFIPLPPPLLNNCRDVKVPVGDLPGNCFSDDTMIGRLPRLVAGTSFEPDESETSFRAVSPEGQPCTGGSVRAPVPHVVVG